MDAVFTLSDSQYGRLLLDAAKGGEPLVGRPVEIIWRLGRKAIRYKARIERVAARIASGSGGVAVHARLEDAQNPMPIRSGTFVEVLVPDRLYRHVARLPQSALYGGDHVFVIGPDDRLERRRVELLAHDGGDVLLRGELRVGERVVVSRLSTIGPGLKVREIGEKKGKGARPAGERGNG
jgi:multidrug efflux pump subunit AcrA (membrane-fusion protein)